MSPSVLIIPLLSATDGGVEREEGGERWEEVVVGANVAVKRRVTPALFMLGEVMVVGKNSFSCGALRVEVSA